MLIAPTLTKDEFKQLHNALCALDASYSNLEGVLAPARVERLGKAITDARAALKRSYELEHETFLARSKHADELRTEHDLSSHWSMYEIEDFSAIPFPQANSLQYGTRQIPLAHPASWLRLWQKADILMRQAGPSNHVFIESFTLQPDGKIVSLSTGS